MFHLKPSLVSINTRLQLWKTFFRSHILYGLETFLIDRPSMNKVSTIYSVSLKTALKLPMSCSTNLVLLHTNTWTLENLFAYKFLTTIQLYNQHFIRRESLPTSMQRKVESICTRLNIQPEELREISKANLKNLISVTNLKELLSPVFGQLAGSNMRQLKLDKIFFTDS